MVEATSPMKRKQPASNGSIADGTGRKKKKVAKPAVHNDTPQSPEPQAQQPGGQPVQKAEPTKQQKKKKKRLDKQQDADPSLAASEHAAPAPPEPTQGNGVHSPDATGSKKKRKKQKQAAQQQAADAAGTDRAAPVAKTKARAAKAAVDTGNAAVRAVVGDQGLADSLPPIVKHLYQEAPSVAALTAAEVDSWRLERTTGIRGCDLNPVMTFKDAGFPAPLLAVTKGFQAPSPIQAQCWPVLLSGQDLIGNAATGSGKTLAFILPGLAHIKAQPEATDPRTAKCPQALVLAPTRELAQQILAVASEAGGHVNARCCLAVGGLPRREQAAELKRGVAIVVATPGRLQDLVADNICRLQRVSYLVLDEADRMLDLGFEPAIREIAGRTRADRQTAMFSATWPPGINKLAKEFLAEPARVNIGSTELAASHSIAQTVEVVEAQEKDTKLQGLLTKHHKSRTNRILIFVLYKKEAARVEGALHRKGWKAAAIHGDLTQAARNAAIEGFRDGSTPLLVATDVAARGLDIPDVSLVINYSFPLTVEDYVHRVGRTGRAGQAGRAHTLFCVASDKGLAGGLVNVLKEAEQPVPPELAKLGGTVKKKESKLYGAHFRDVDTSVKASKITFEDSD